MWPFGTKKRVHIEAELVELQASIEDALKHEAPAGKVRALSHKLGSLALEAGDQITTKHGTWALIRRARDSADLREQSAMQARSDAVLDQLRGCTGCKGRDFFLSHTLTIGELMSKAASERSPTMRLAVCANCGKTTIWTVNLDEVHESGHFSHTTVRAKGGDGGPFRDE